MKPLMDIHIIITVNGQAYSLAVKDVPYDDRVADVFSAIQQLLYQHSNMLQAEEPNEP